MTRFLLPTILLLGLLAGTVKAQSLQLPAFGINAVQTAVSVPDRGSAFLGGVSRGATSSKQFGFSPFGSSLGRAHSNAAQRVFVTIHDFKEIDRQLLSVPRNDGRDRRQFENTRAKSAWRQLSGSRR